jgi:HEAT repeat protein
MIRFACPHCRKGLKAGNEKAGSRARCPKCRSPIQVPIPDGESDPPAAVKQRAPIPEPDQLESPGEEQERKQKTGFLFLGLFVSGLICGTVLFVVLFIKIKEAKLSRPAHDEQGQLKSAAGQSVLPPWPPKRPPLAETPDERSEAAKQNEPVPPVHEPKEEEYEAPPKKARSLPMKPVEAPASINPSDELSLRESEQIVTPFVKDLRHRKIPDRLQAIDALARLGPKAKAASRPLCESLFDPSVRVRLAAAEALEKVNPTLHRLVIPVLVDKELENRLECVRKIGELGPEGNPAVPVLLWFKDQYPGGSLIVEALAAIAPDERSVTAQAAAWLTSDRDPYVRLAAVKALPRMAGARDQVRALVYALRSDSVDAVRAAAANALGDLGPDGKDVRTALQLAKTDASAQVREAAERALAKIPR